MNFLRRLSFAAVLFGFSAAGIYAQNGTSGKTGTAAPPFAPGETLTYEGKIRKILPTIAIADLTFTLSQAGEDFVVKADARSKGTLLKMFRYSFLQEIESVFGRSDSRIKTTKKHDVQKDRVRDSEAVFDYPEGRVTYTETDPKEPMRPPRRIASEIGPETYDMVSAIYRLRTLPLAVGSTFRLPVSDSGLVYDIPVKVTARERQKTAIGRVWCFRVEPDVFGPGRLIEREGNMTIWITDDQRRVPVRALVNTSIGRFDIRIKTAKNLRT